MLELLNLAGDSFSFSKSSIGSAGWASAAFILFCKQILGSILTLMKDLLIGFILMILFLPLLSGRLRYTGQPLVYLKPNEQTYSSLAVNFVLLALVHSDIGHCQTWNKLVYLFSKHIDNKIITVFSFIDLSREFIKFSSVLPVWASFCCHLFLFTLLSMQILFHIFSDLKLC